MQWFYDYTLTSLVKMTDSKIICQDLWCESFFSTYINNIHANKIELEELKELIFLSKWIFSGDIGYSFSLKQFKWMTGGYKVLSCLERTY